jgi:DNA polymerase
VSGGDDLRDELRGLVGDLRRGLAERARTGARTAPAGATPRPDAAVEAAARGADDGASVTEGGVATGRGGRATLPQVRAWLGECTRCRLHETRTSIVFGTGAADAPLLFVGEAPGAEEDRRGEPFVGAAGQLLDKMIEAMGWRRDEVYIANVLKCRPPGNRDPRPDEVEACGPFLARQIEALAPRIIVTLGKPAAHALLSTTAPISSLRGRWHDHRGIKVMPTFHPAFLLREPGRKRDAWNDLKLVIDELARLGVRPPRAPRE